MGRTVQLTGVTGHAIHKIGDVGLVLRCGLLFFGLRDDIEIRFQPQDIHWTDLDAQAATDTFVLIDVFNHWFAPMTSLLSFVVSNIP